MKKLLLLAIVALSSCVSDDKRCDINCQYNGAIIYEKYDFRNINKTVYYDFKYQGEIIHIQAYEKDFNYYVGDTINKPCIN